MGLDISIYKQIQFVASDEDEGMTPEKMDNYYDRYIWIYCNESFPKQADGIRTGFYTGEYVSDFRAGSYSGYNYFRNKLCKLALDVDAEQVWNNLNDFADQPFVDLINFSDCEGAIGPVTSARLFKDFEKYLDKAKALKKEGPYDYFLDTYVSFMDAFRVAATENGVVTFH